MSALTPHQQQAFRAACQLIDRQRASDIRRLKHWQHGMCGCLNAVKPNMPDVALPRERRDSGTLGHVARLVVLDDGPVHAL